MGVLSKTFYEKTRQFGKNLSNTRFNETHKNYLNKHSAFTKPGLQEAKTPSSNNALLNKTNVFFKSQVEKQKVEIVQPKMEECDLKVMGNPQYVTEYIHEIVETMKENEVRIFSLFFIFYNIFDHNFTPTKIFLHLKFLS